MTLQHPEEDLWRNAPLPIHEGTTGSHSRGFYLQGLQATIVNVRSLTHSSFGSLGLTHSRLDHPHSLPQHGTGFLQISPFPGDSSAASAPQVTPSPSSWGPPVPFKRRLHSHLPALQIQICCHPGSASCLRTSPSPLRSPPDLPDLDLTHFSFLFL